MHKKKQPFENIKLKRISGRDLIIDFWLKDIMVHKRKKNGLTHQQINDPYDS